jgi:hypothetical protein
MCMETWVFVFNVSDDTSNFKEAVNLLAGKKNLV